MYHLVMSCKSQSGRTTCIGSVAYLGFGKGEAKLRGYLTGVIFSIYCISLMSKCMGLQKKVGGSKGSIAEWPHTYAIVHWLYAILAIRVCNFQTLPQV
jgi:hypothetical protein